MISWLEAAVLGVVQGLTEFLPISSSAHLLIVSQVFGWEDPGAAFTAVTSVVWSAELTALSKMSVVGNISLPPTVGFFA